jgi:bifunctional DNase/RNase
MENQLVEVVIRRIELPSEDSPPMVILEETRGTRSIPIPVGPFEASAILLELEGIMPPRPLTHDLLADLFREAGFRLDRVELFGKATGGPRARLAYRKGFRVTGKEVRPSDALALAQRLGAPVMVHPDLLDDGPLPGKAETRLDLSLDRTYTCPHGPFGAY